MPSDSTTFLVVPVEWAQRKHHIYINFRVEDLDPKSTSVDISEEKVSFKGKTSSTGKELSSTLELFGQIKPEESKYFVRGRGAEVVLVKKEASPYWKRLLKEDKKFHWLRVDFDKWQDEDDSDDEANGGGGSGGGGFGNMNFEEMMRQMGGLGGGGLGGGADLDGFGDDDEDDGEGGTGEQDSDDDKLPELEETTSKPSNNTT